MSGLWGGFPSREGIKGCVTVRGAIWAEVIILLLFDEEVFLGLGVDVFGVGGCAWASHTPDPSGEGRFENCVLFGNE